MSSYQLERNLLRRESRKRTDKTIIFLHNFRTAGTTLTRNITDINYHPQEVLHANRPPEHPRWIRNLSPINLLKIKYISGHMAFGIHHCLLHQNFTYISLIRDPIDRILSVYYVLRSEQGKGHPLQKICLEHTLEDLHTIEFYEEFKKRKEPHIALAYEYFHNYQSRMFSNREILQGCSLRPTPKTCSTIAESFFFDQTHFNNVILNIEQYCSFLGFSSEIEKDWNLLVRRFGWRMPPEHYFTSMRKTNYLKQRPSVASLSLNTQNQIRFFNQYDYTLVEYVRTHQQRLNTRPF